MQSLSLLALSFVLAASFSSLQASSSAHYLGQYPNAREFSVDPEIHTIFVLEEGGTLVDLQLDRRAWRQDLKKLRAQRFEFDEPLIDIELCYGAHLLLGESGRIWERTGIDQSFDLGHFPGLKSLIGNGTQSFLGFTQDKSLLMLQRRARRSPAKGDDRIWSVKLLAREFGSSPSSKSVFMGDQGFFSSRALFLGIDQEDYLTLLDGKRVLKPKVKQVLSWNKDTLAVLTQESQVLITNLEGSRTLSFPTPIRQIQNRGENLLALTQEGTLIQYFPEKKTFFKDHPEVYQEVVGPQGVLRFVIQRDFLVFEKEDGLWVQKLSVDRP